MKYLAGIIVGLALLGCQENISQESEFTGNEIVYSLQQGSVYTISGIVTLKERKDGSTQILVDLKGTEGNIQLPVHLHLGDLSQADADVAALLNPVDARTGKSETNLKRLANEEAITYAELTELIACIKIHLAETGPDRDIILAGGNIGAALQFSTGGRYGIGVCKSE
jgi:hypothetical protein